MFVDSEQDTPLASKVVDVRSISIPWNGITVVTNNLEDSITDVKFLRKVGRYAESEGGAYLTQLPNKFITVHRSNKKNGDPLPVQWIEQMTGSDLVSGEGELTLGDVVFVLSPLEYGEYLRLDEDENVEEVYVYSNVITAYWDDFVADAHIQKQELIYRFTTE